MSQQEKSSGNTKKSSLTVIVLIVVLALAAGLGWYFYGKSPQKKPAVTVETPRQLPDQLPPAAPVPDEEPAPAIEPQEPAPVIQAEKEKSECELVEQEIKEFFSYLDGQDYVAARQLQGGSLVHFSKVIDKLIANPPIISRETESLYSILNNTAHFYRILHKDDVFLIKEILEKEGALLESVMALFYRWSELASECEKTTLQVHLPLPGLYDYAGFFLNTLGGQSYLFRRESRVRILIKYYSVLAMDRANEANINRYGIDIRPGLESLIAEMQGATNLNSKDEYLARLLVLQDKYLQEYGDKGLAQPSK